MKISDSSMAQGERPPRLFVQTSAHAETSGRSHLPAWIGLSLSSTFLQRLRTLKALLESHDLSTVDFLLPDPPLCGLTGGWACNGALVELHRGGCFLHITAFLEPQGVHRNPDEIAHWEEKSTRFLNETVTASVFVDLGDPISFESQTFDAWSPPSDLLCLAASLDLVFNIFVQDDLYSEDTKKRMSRDAYRRLRLVVAKDLAALNQPPLDLDW